MTTTEAAPRPATAVERSENAKLGDCSATYVSRASCPGDCPVYAECYASPGQAHGFVGITTARLGRSPERRPEALARFEAAAIAGLSGLRPLRLHVVGDATTRAAVRVLVQAAKSYRKRGQQARLAKTMSYGLFAPGAIVGDRYVSVAKFVEPPPVWTYTHAWRTVKRRWWGDQVSVLASCETVADVRAAWQRGYAACIIVPEHPSESAYDLGGGVRAVPCPYETRGVTCDRCRLCFDDAALRRRGMAIAFQAKGSRSNDLKRKLIALQTVESP